MANRKAPIKYLQLFSYFFLEIFHEFEGLHSDLSCFLSQNRPFIFYKEKLDPNNYDTSIDSWYGFCIDLLKEIGFDLGLNFTIQLVKDGKFGGVVPNETYPDGSEKWNGIIGELISKVGLSSPQ